MSYPELPHFAAPFTFTNAGANVVEQDSVEDVASCVYNIASCPVGFITHNPDFGVDDLSFATVPVNTIGLVEEVGDQEPRAILMATESGSPLNVSLRNIQLRVSVAGPPSP